MGHQGNSLIPDAASDCSVLWDTTSLLWETTASDLESVDKIVPDEAHGENLLLPESTGTVLWDSEPESADTIVLDEGHRENSLLPESAGAALWDSNGLVRTSELESVD